MSLNKILHQNYLCFLSGVDSTRLPMSLSTAWRDRRSQAEFIAEEEIESFFCAVQDSGDRVLVQFNEKELEVILTGILISTLLRNFLATQFW